MLILAAPVIFGLTVRGLGLAPSIALAVFITAFASRRTSIVLAVAMSCGADALLRCGVQLRPTACRCASSDPGLAVLRPWSSSPISPSASPPPSSRSIFFYCFLGVLLGTLIGVLPGIGPTATIAMLLPITFALSPATSLIMLAGIYYGAQYGGSTTAILINLPGESSSAVTAIDGYQMARQGRAGPALATAALGSFFAGTVATMLLALFAPPLTRMALNFGPAEYFSLMILGLVTSVALAHGSILKALAMIVLGLLLGLVGTDIYTGTPRFTFGLLELADGLNFVAVAVGVFGIAEILRNLENETDRDVVIQKVTGLMPSRADLRAIIGPVLRGTALGLGARHPAGRRRHPFVLRRLFRREAHLEHAAAFRQGRHRGRRRAGSRQQCRRADLVHPHADSRHPRQSRSWR